MQMCCSVSQVCQSPAKCGVCAVIWFLYSEKATRNVVLRYSPSLWQHSATHCSWNKGAPEAFSMGIHWSPTIIRPDLASCDFHLFSRVKLSEEDNILIQWAADQHSELAESTGGWLLWQGYWKVVTTLWKMFTSERWVCREVAGWVCREIAGRCG